LGVYLRAVLIVGIGSCGVDVYIKDAGCNAIEAD
jgi:hypothetical protein